MGFEPHELRSMIRAQRQRLCAVGIHSANKLAESCVIWRVVRQIADNLLPSISAFMRLSLPHSNSCALKYGKLKVTILLLSAVYHTYMWKTASFRPADCTTIENCNFSNCINSTKRVVNRVSTMEFCFLYGKCPISALLPLFSAVFRVFFFYKR